MRVRKIHIQVFSFFMGFATLSFTVALAFQCRKSIDREPASDEATASERQWFLISNIMYYMMAGNHARTRTWRGSFNKRLSSPARRIARSPVRLRGPVPTS